MIAPEGSSCGSVPVEHLDYSFIQNCSDLKHLEQILRVLRSGQEGFYPDLVEFCETHIGKLFPRSRVLRKENRASTAGSFSSEEWRNICEDLQMWERNMRADEEELKRSAVSSDVEPVPPVPPVRSSNARVQRSVSTAVETGKTSHIPRPYQDWDRFDVEAECSKIDEISTTIRAERPTVKQTVSSTALTAQEKHTLARREKDKGNDAFRSGDYEEAMLYYSRSLSLAPSVAALNNRAQTLIRLERWSAALSDCDAALLLEPHNCKALLRRATVRKHLCLLQESRDDLRTVLLLEPHNTTAQKLLRGETEQESRGTGRKILIQEVDEEEEDEGVQHESRREKRDESEAESGIMGNTHTMKTDSAGAPPTGHTHREHEEHTPLNNTQAISEHTAAELQRLTDEADGCVRSGCYQDALQRYTHCLQLHPQQYAVYTSRALCFIRLQLFTEARQDCDSALQIQPTNKKALYRRALANKSLKDYPACRSDLQQLLRLDTSVTEAEQLLMEITHLMNHTHPAAARRTVHITEVDDDDGDDDDEGQDGGAGGSSTVPQVCDVFEFGQALSATPAAAPGHTHSELHHPSAAHTPAAHTLRAGAADPATAARHTPIPRGVGDVGS